MISTYGLYEICKVTQNVLLELSPIGRLENVVVP